MKNQNAECLSRALLVAMFAVAIWTWPSAPASVPIHWNFQGQIDGYGSRFVGVFLLPMAGLGGYVLVSLGPTLRPEKFDGPAMNALSWFELAYMLLMATVFSVVIADVRGANINMNHVIYPALAVLMLASLNLVLKTSRARAAKTPPRDGGVRV